MDTLVTLEGKENMSAPAQESDGVRILTPGAVRDGSPMSLMEKLGILTDQV